MIKEAIKNYKESQKNLGDSVLKSIMNGIYKVEIKEIVTSPCYIAEVNSKVEELNVCLTVASNFICVHERNGILLDFSSDVQKEFISFVKKQVNDTPKEKIKEQIKALKEKLKNLDKKD